MRLLQLSSKQDSWPLQMPCQPETCFTTIIQAEALSKLHKFHPHPTERDSVVREIKPRSGYSDVTPKFSPQVFEFFPG